MSTFNEKILEAWNEWEANTGAEANNPDDFVAWAMDNKKLLPHIQDIRKLLRKQVTSALRQASRMDEEGFSYRAKQCVMIAEKGLQLRLWFDTDKGGTPNLRQKAVRQRRDGIASDVYRAICDVEHMNKAFPDDPQLNFFMDFADDCAERRAAELAARDKDEDEDGEAA
ncbi:MAG: hypothetical protein P4L61_00625 [Candidatus Pacebacteria bacterium]|nr:hypothetical protein [Candidatus Paceibacterota bacterium]